MKQIIIILLVLILLFLTIQVSTTEINKVNHPCVNINAMEFFWGFMAFYESSMDLECLELYNDITNQIPGRERILAQTP